MKKTAKALQVIAVVSASIISMRSYGQCKADELANAAVVSLERGFSFLKSYKLKGEPEKDKVEFSYVFSKGTQYQITLQDDNSNLGTIVTLYDSRRNKLASNKLDGQLLKALTFPCSATGVHYIQFTFEPGASKCAGSALGFRRF